MELVQLKCRLDSAVSGPSSLGCIGKRQCFRVEDDDNIITSLYEHNCNADYKASLWITVLQKELYKSLLTIRCYNAKN